jgi:hypothetical protein
MVTVSSGILAASATRSQPAPPAPRDRVSYAGLVDQDLRRLEREAADGRLEAVGRLVHAYVQAGRDGEAYALAWEHDLPAEELSARLRAQHTAVAAKLGRHPRNRTRVRLAWKRHPKLRWSWSVPWLDRLPGPVLAIRLGSKPPTPTRLRALLEFTSAIEVDAASCGGLGHDRILALAGLPALRTLRLGGTRCNDRTLRELAKVGGLRCVDLSGQPTRATRRGAARLMEERPDLTLLPSASLLEPVLEQALLGHCLEGLFVGLCDGRPELARESRRLTLELLTASAPVPPDALTPVLSQGAASSDDRVFSVSADALAVAIEHGAEPHGVPLEPVGHLLGAVHASAERLLRAAVVAGRRSDDVGAALAQLRPEGEPEEDRLRQLRVLLEAREAQPEVTSQVSGVAVAPRALLEWWLARGEAVDVDVLASDLPRTVLACVSAALQTRDPHGVALAQRALTWLTDEGVDVRPAYPHLPAGHGPPPSAERRGLLHKGSSLNPASYEGDVPLSLALAAWEAAREGADLTAAAPHLRAALAKARAEGAEVAAYFLALALHHHHWRHPDESLPELPDAPAMPAELHRGLGIEPGERAPEWWCYVLSSPDDPNGVHQGHPSDPGAEAPRACAACGDLATECVSHSSDADMAGSEAEWTFACPRCGWQTHYGYRD